MIISVNLFLFTSILFLLERCFYLEEVYRVRFKPLLNQSCKQLSKNDSQREKLLFLKNCKTFSYLKKKSKSLDLESDLKLKKYNEQLNKCLKTLDYISNVELSSCLKNNMDQLSEILNFKSQIQRDVIELTSKINTYKLIHKKKKSFKL